MIEFKELKNVLNPLEDLNFLPIWKLDTTSLLSWVKPITNGSNIFAFFYITKLKTGNIRLEFLISPPIYLGSMPELVSCCFYQKLAVCDSLESVAVKEVIDEIAFILSGEKELEELIKLELQCPSFCTYRKIKPEVTTNRYIIHLKRLELILSSPWIGEYIERAKKKNIKIDKIIPEEQDKYFDQQLRDIYAKEFEVMDELSRESALKSWGAYFLVQYLTGYRII